MSYPSFIIFKAARRFQAGYLDLEWDVKTFIFQKCDYNFAGQVPFYHHIQDNQNRLVGFAIDQVTHYVNQPALLSWISEAENVLYELDTAFFYIYWPFPITSEHDGASLIGANFYHDGHGNFLIIIGDAKANDENGQFQNLWSEIAFPLAPAKQFVVKEYSKRTS
ncbi:MAG TPA: hypothetical protein VHG71_05215 [Verrucomicrobiae bacterium]|nr:hypothetical protein [Verrucomicrobiae bacterium]